MSARADRVVRQDPPALPFPAALLLLSLLVLACDPAVPASERGEALAPVVFPVVFEEELLDLIEAWRADGGRARVEREHARAPLGVVPAEFEAIHRREAAPLVVRALPESRFTFPLDVPATGGVLEVATFVRSFDPGARDPEAGRFVVRIDERAVWELDAGYAHAADAPAHPFERAIRTHEIDLQPHAGRRVVLAFETTRATAPRPERVQDELAWWRLAVRRRQTVPRQHAGANAPHLLVICVDTLSAGRTSLARTDRATTPRLAAFAERALVFERGLSPSSWTLPATASLLTGLPPNTHGVIGDSRSYLMDSLVTWPERLQRQGLDGAAFVANTLVAQGNNFDQGFAHWEQLDEQPADALNARLLAWIDAQPDGARWFAYVHYMDPHAPYDPPAPERARFAGDYVERRDFSGHLPGRLQRGELEPFTRDEQRHVADLYDAEVAAWDRAFGALLDALEARGLLELTAIVLTADHGEELFEHGALGHGYALHEELLHVPLLVADPRLPPGRRSAPVGTAAVFNTVLALAGADVLEEGRAPALTDETAPGTVFSGTITRLFGPDRALVGARRGDDKVVLTLRPDEQGGERLDEVVAYDLDADPDEQRPLDLAALPAARRAAFTDLVDDALAWHRETAARRPPQAAPPDPTIEERLRSLGYVGEVGPDGGDAR